MDGLDRHLPEVCEISWPGSATPMVARMLLPSDGDLQHTVLAQSFTTPNMGSMRSRSLDDLDDLDLHDSLTYDLHRGCR